MRRHPPRLLIPALLVVLAGACGEARIDVDSAATDGGVSTGTNAPDPWAEIEADFFLACAESVSGPAGAAGLDAYCQCAYEETVEFHGTVEAFTSAERVADDPLVTDPLLEVAFAGCADAHLN